MTYVTGEGKVEKFLSIFAVTFCSTPKFESTISFLLNGCHSCFRSVSAEIKVLAGIQNALASYQILASLFVQDDGIM